MSRFNNDKVMPRFFAIALILTLIGLAIIGKALYIMTAKKDYWTQVADRQKRDSLSVKPRRGNILSSDGQLMASTIPEYRMFIDFQAMKESHKDSIWAVKLDSVCNGLHEVFPEKSAAEFKAYLEEGRTKVQKNGTVGSRHWAIWKRRVNYNKFSQVHSLPVLDMPFNSEQIADGYIVRSSYKSGFNVEEYTARVRPFGSLALRTVGGMYGAKDSAYYGLELSYDSLLRGTPGITDRRKVLNKYMNIPVTLPTDGCDIVSTIDVNMQDLAERSLLDMLEEPALRAELGVAILMEVETGDVKAIVNMVRNTEGRFIEAVNSAISYRCEPGSVFKTASFLVALDDGVVDTTFRINTGCGVLEMHGRLMKDHNWRRGGYGDMNVARALEVSSNIGVSYVIDKFYNKDPKRYVEGLYRVGIGEDLKLPLVGYQKPNIRMPDTKTTDRAKYWSKTTLPWMSIGYETQIAPINTVTFYNAIANNGKMMRPRFVKSIVRNGETVKEFAPEVIKERIAKPHTIKTMQTILEHVVSQGLGKKAGSKLFKVAGKTGTAQVADQYGSYHSGLSRYWLSFAGYFPADQPRYSCIVCIKMSGLPVSGGGTSGVVFHKIAEGVMARNLKRSVVDARDSLSILVPDVKNGDILAANYALSHLGVKSENHWEGTYAKGNPIWGTAERKADDVALTKMATADNIVPDVTGMGARDAVFMFESRGVKTILRGRGKVKQQSLPPGKAIAEGDFCVLNLE